MSDDTLIGGTGDDTIIGGLGDDSLVGGAGNDSLLGGNDSDTLDGGSDADTLNGGGGFDFASYQSATVGAIASLRSGRAEGAALDDIFVDIEGILGSDFDDNFAGNSEANRLEGNGGNDILIGDAGNDTLIGGSGGDSLYGEAGFDTVDYRSETSAVIVSLLTGRAEGAAAGDRWFGIESIAGTSFDDNLGGGSGNNAIFAEAGDDILIGRDGNDTLNGGAGADSIYGGDGFDTADYSREASGAVISFLTGRAEGSATGDRWFDIEALVGSSFDDNLGGGAAANSISGGDGNDLLLGRAGNDTLIGGAGGDTLYGDEGFDTVSYRSSTSGVIVSFQTGRAEGDAAGDRWFDIESIAGSSFDDNLGGDLNNNAIFAEAGDDLLIGRAGDDTLNGGSGADSMYGGEGFDTADYSRESSGVIVSFLTGRAEGSATGDRWFDVEGLVGTSFDDNLGGDGSNNSIKAGAGNDLLLGRAGNDTLVGGSGADSIYGDAGFDSVDYRDETSGAIVSFQSGRAEGSATGDRWFGVEAIFGSSFNDNLGGDAEANLIIGRAGDDLLIGRSGNDTLSGGSGSDTLFGESGADSFQFDDGHQNVKVQDFSTASGDVIELAGFGAGVSSFDDIISLGTNVSGSAVFDFGDGDMLTLVGVLTSDLSADDFSIG